MSQTPGQFFEEIVELINLNWHKYNLRSKLIELLIAHDAEVRAETLQEERREILERADGMDAVWIRGWLVSRLHGAAKHLPDPHYRERIELEARIAERDEHVSILKFKLAALDAQSVANLPIDRGYCGRCGNSIPECKCVADAPKVEGR